jgi:hypothetical protein
MRRPSLKKILTDPPRRPGQRCRVCSDPEVAEAVASWASARAAGGATTLSGFHARYLHVVYQEAPCFSSVRGHVLRCLRLDPVTARPIR